MCQRVLWVILSQTSQCSNHHSDIFVVFPPHKLPFVFLIAGFFLPHWSLLYCRIDAVYHHCTRRRGVSHNRMLAEDYGELSDARILTAACDLCVFNQGSAAGVSCKQEVLVRLQGSLTDIIRRDESDAGLFWCNPVPSQCLSVCLCVAAFAWLSLAAAAHIYCGCPHTRAHTHTHSH